MKSVQWEKFPYSVIVVPGAGPDTLAWSFSPEGKARVTLAAKRFRDGKAPFILVSGGYVHPSQTPYCEALEMKKSLIADFGIPADAILIDPHARHTTTNIRNAVREIYRYGMPFGKKALITTDPAQSASIENPA
ncbi:MAG TPA: YdcF family protein, partial [Bryobacteraceae bacterium]|nr:YdcF family protein [Bryobacteraceae bacterium]